jgi:uncharacterized protein YaaR (DUF327 family)
MSRARSDSEAMEMVEEIQKKLANLAQRVAQMSRARSTPQALNQTGECGGFRG